LEAQVTERTSDGLDLRRRKLLFRCWHRGMREMDLIMGRFADSSLAELSDDELADLERLIELPDRDLLEGPGVRRDLEDVGERVVLRVVVDDADHPVLGHPVVQDLIDQAFAGANDRGYAKRSSYSPRQTESSPGTPDRSASPPKDRIHPKKLTHDRQRNSSPPQPHAEEH